MSIHTSEVSRPLLSQPARVLYDPWARPDLRHRHAPTHAIVTNNIKESPLPAMDSMIWYMSPSVSSSLVLFSNVASIVLFSCYWQ